MSINEELHFALEILGTKPFAQGKTIAETLKNYNNLKTCETTITATTASSTIVVKDSKDQIVNAVGGKYNLPRGGYTIINSKENFITKTTNIVVSEADVLSGTKTVTLAALDAQ